MSKDFSLDELIAEARVFIETEDPEAAEGLDWFLRSLDPEKRYTTADLKNVLALLSGPVIEKEET
jgi:hypothetical protein